MRQLGSLAIYNIDYDHSLQSTCRQQQAFSYPFYDYHVVLYLLCVCVSRDNVSATFF